MDFISSKGRVAVDVGRGWLSRYEAGILAEGGVIRSEDDAGSPHFVSLNGEYLCDGSLAVFGERLFLRVESLEPDARPRPFPERANDATELLPFAIRVAAVEVRISELAGIGRRSYIELDRAFREDEDAELVVAGLPVAAGKVAVIGERLGMRVARRLAEPYRDPEVRTTGSLLPPGYGAEPVKDYRFKMPDVFTKRGILRAQELHLEFLRTIQARSAAAAGYRLELVDQLSYGEWLDAQPAAGRSYALLPTLPSRGREAAAEPPRRLVARAAAGESTSLGEETLAALRSCAEQSLRPAGARPVVLALGGDALSLLDEDPGLGVTASCLRNGWKRVADLRVEAPAGALAGSGFASERAPGGEAAYPGEMILLARFASAGGGSLELVYPLRCLEALFAELNR
jgi:flagellar motor switch/type III secretory pathway protein FliN